MFRSPRKPPTQLSEPASFKQCLDYYTQRVKLSENKLASIIRINQQRLNDISNEKTKNVDTETLVRICLALGLNEEESFDLMARRERTLSPAKPEHRAYRELIRLYSGKEINYNVPAKELEDILNDADQYLNACGFTRFEFKNIGTSSKKSKTT